MPRQHTAPSLRCPLTALLLNHRIPMAAIDGTGGAAELRYGGPAIERGAGALVETGGKASRCMPTASGARPTT